VTPSNSPGFPLPGSVDIALSARAHDRAGHRRTDRAWLEQTWADPGTRVLPLAASQFPVTGDGTSVDWRPSAGLPPGERIFLGVQHEIAHFALLLEEPLPGEDWVSFRLVAANLSADDRALLVHAIALAEWHLAHRHCPRCGGLLEVSAAGHVLTCSDCGKQQFPRTDPAVIMLVTDGERALLGRQATWPEGRYSTLAGFVDPGESFEAAVAREVAEEVGVQVDQVTYFGNQPWPFPASLMIGFFARALTFDIVVDGDEISDARWFSRQELKTQAEAGRLLLPSRISISRSLVEAWYGAPLPGQW
jgi:NAD+ diphosphatase